MPGQWAATVWRGGGEHDAGSGARPRKVYGGRAVVDGVSFDVEEGEIFGILGPNGAGRTTTVECIEGLRMPDGGEVEVAGFDPQREEAQVRALLGAQPGEPAACGAAGR